MVESEALPGQIAIVWLTTGGALKVIIVEYNFLPWYVNHVSVVLAHNLRVRLASKNKLSWEN
jgi:hypothetical protein